MPGCHKRETSRQDPAEDPGSAGAGRKDGVAPVRGRAAPTSTATATLAPDVASARQQAEEFVAASDIVKASDEDLMWLYPDAAAGESLAAWLELRWQP